MKGRTLFVVLLAVAAAAAQRPEDRPAQRVHIHLDSADGGCDPSARITLSGQFGPSFEGVQNAHCDVEFSNVPEGAYHVEIASREFTSNDVSSNIFVSFGGPADFDVRLRRSTPPDYSGMHGSAFVSASDLAVPGRARKEFDKANQLITRQEFQDAIHKLEKAIRIYPQYAIAYNNLAVIYSKLGDRKRETEALQKAISIKPDFALAYVNLGRMNLRGNDTPAAETAFTKAADLSPSDPITLILLSYSEFLDQHFDAAIETSHKAHELQQPHSVAHRVAARAFEQQKQGAKAIAELEAFLREEPTGPRSDAARHEIEVVRAALPN